MGVRSKIGAVRHRLGTSRQRVANELGDLRAPTRTWFKYQTLYGTQRPRGLAGGWVSPNLGRPNRPEAVHVHPDAFVGDDATFTLGPEGQVHIGSGTTIGRLFHVYADAEVRIGADVEIGHVVAITDTWTYGEVIPGLEPEPVIIGDGAVIGTRVCLGPGVVIAPGAIVPHGVVLHAGDPIPSSVDGYVDVSAS